MKIQDLDLSKTYTYADYLTWHFAERIELIRGQIFKMSPAPNLPHQEISANLFITVGTFFKNRNCKAFSAPFDIRLLLPPGQVTDDKIDTVVQPDICVICDSEKMDRRGGLGAPDWIIEILSPSTAKKDKENKYDLYEFAGVKEYWIVDPESKQVFIYSLNEQNKYLSLGPFGISDTIHPVLFPDLAIELRDIFPTIDYVEEEWDDNYIRL